MAALVPRFSRHRRDHSPPDLLDDDELARAIDSLTRKLHAARRRFVVATGVRVALYAAAAVSGLALLGLGPAPIVAYFRKSRQLVTAWDVAAWWLAVIGVTAITGALLAQAVRQRRRQAAGWRHRVDDLAHRLAEAREVQQQRATGA